MITTVAELLEYAQARNSLQAVEDRLLRQRDALLRLTAAQPVDCEALPAALRVILEVSAAALCVSRASIWRYDDDRCAIVCVDLYDSSSRSHETGARLLAADFPSYFRAISESEIVAVEDALNDPRTCEFADPYLEPLDVRSMMDVPLHLKGDVIGVICFEDVQTRAWTTDERAFALAISNLVSLAFEKCERARAEATLRLQAAALDAAAQAITITDCDKRIVWANPAFVRLTGYGIGELIGQDPTQLLKPEDQSADCYEGVVPQLLAGRVWHGERVNRRKDGSTFVAEQTITPVRNTAGQVTHFVSMRIDLTERRNLEAQFLQAQKMEVVGRLAGGIAHDFNNLLTVINGVAELVIEDLAPSHPLYADIERIQESGKRAATLTRQLLTFSRKEISQRQPLDVGAVLLDLRSMLQRLIGEDIKLEVRCDDNAGCIVADQSQFEQIILNLAVNAKDAMPRGGTLNISVRTRQFTTPPAGLTTSIKAGRYVALSIADDGIGMTEGIKARIFEPFFTTKGAGKGTGLGLATVYAIVEQSGGAIRVDSAPGRGATFTIYLPQIDAAEGVIDRQPGDAPRGAETILLVEDDEAVRDVGRRMLEQAGYHVLTAPDAPAAERVVADHAGTIDLLLTDVVLPSVGGRGLASILSNARPNLRVIYTSGYTDDTILAHGVRENAVHFIAKPYSPHALAIRVREVLDAPQPPRGGTS